MKLIRSRYAFTLIEILTVLAIISILIAVLAPAVQMARESARRASCQNALRQMGIAFHSYESSHGRMPFQHSHSPLVPILPYCEQNEIYERLIPFRAPDVPPEIYQIVPKLYRCPSHPIDFEMQDLGVACYAANIGSGNLTMDDAQAHVPDGTFELLSSTSLRFTDVTDGLSNTSAYSEIRFLPGDAVKRQPQFAFRRFDSPSGSPRKRLPLVRQICINGPFYASLPTRHGAWILRAPNGGYYNHLLPPNSPNCMSISEVWIGSSATSSFHFGGAHSMFCDSSVRFIPDMIDEDVWYALGSRAGGENAHFE